MKCLRCGCDYGPRLPACDECGAHLGAELCPAGTLDALRELYDMHMMPVDHADEDEVLAAQVRYDNAVAAARAILDKAKGDKP